MSDLRVRQGSPDSRHAPRQAENLAGSRGPAIRWEWSDAGQPFSRRACRGYVVRIRLDVRSGAPSLPRAPPRLPRITLPIPHKAGPPPWVRSILRHARDGDPHSLRQAEAEAAGQPALRALIQAYARGDQDGLEELDAAVANTPWSEPEGLALRVMRLDGAARARERVAGAGAGRPERALCGWILAYALWRTG
mgnify:CR=1 FL=1